MDEIYYWVWISRMNKLTYESFSNLIEQYGSIQNLWNLKRSDLVKEQTLNWAEINELFSIEHKLQLDKYVDAIKRYNVKLISCYDCRYPIKLNFINNRPIVLYALGDVGGLNNESVSVVGSRNCTTYGIKNANYFSKELSKRGVNVISGLAKGIDAVAHNSCIDEGGKTIAVIGNGLDYIYPKENRNLAKKILNNRGTIISEYPFGTKPLKQNFPRRNRIISGMSNAVIVVEAGEKSGSLITAKCALDQGKDVFVIPGDITNNHYKGSNALIKEGANVLTSLEDIINEYHK